MRACQTSMFRKGQETCAPNLLDILYSFYMAAITNMIMIYSVFLAKFLGKLDPWGSCSVCESLVEPGI